MLHVSPMIVQLKRNHVVHQRRFAFLVRSGKILQVSCFGNKQVLSDGRQMLIGVQNNNNRKEILLDLA
jgi:hypothetical protein